MKRVIKKIIFPVIGLLAFIWYLIRAIPKPSRVTYPCMRASAPLASSFVIYILGIFSSALFFKKARKFLNESKYILFSIMLIVGMVLGVSSYLQEANKVYAVNETTFEGPNQPMGIGKGVNPGRVVWIYEPDATDEDCRNRRNDYWCDDKNTNQELVNKMVSDALKMLTDKESDKAAWDAIFRYHNKNHDRGDVGYQKGEKIVIKINLNSNGCSSNSSNYTRKNKRTIDTSPHVTFAVLDQLINKAGVAQSDISVGDPGRNIDDLFWDKCHTVFPEVNYWGKGNGRTPIKRPGSYQIFTSDGSTEDWLPKCYQEATYMINIPVLKKHHRAGISLTSKNHFGSFVPFKGSAFHWHFSLPASEGGGDVNNGDYGLYRCFVDIMGHKDIGAKTILYLIDGLWGSTNWAHPPIKWRMTPFNNDWPSSIFLSQDPVAVQSVGFDFLFEEFDRDHPTEGDYDPSDNKGPFPHYAGVDDFLHQAADSENWPEDIKYDPENDGTILPASLGVHEHWNNAVEKKYSQNLGNDKGIELVSNYDPTHVQTPNSVLKTFRLYPNFPNPFNPSTTIEYNLSVASHVEFSIYNVNGQQISTLCDEYQESGHHAMTWNGRLDNGRTAPSGVYFYKIQVRNNDQSFQRVRKMILSK